jgi:hypothetical protein
MKFFQVLLFKLIFLLPVITYAQYWEVGALLGASNYSGDLVKGVISFRETKPAGGAIIRYNINPWFTLKTDIYFGTITGDDRHSNSTDMKIRNLSFKSNILDIGINGELNLTGYKSGHPIYKTSPYIFFGISVFRFNPKAEYEGKWVPLQPLCTEGQGTTKYNDREKYSLTQISIPLGVGYKFAITRFWNIGVEIGARSTFTDYLDDVSTTYVEKDVLESAYGEKSYYLSNRSAEGGHPMDYTSEDSRGDPTKKDWYYFAGITITYSILPNRCYKF